MPGDPPIDKLLSQLVAINSVNPSLVHGAPGEREIVTFITTWLTARGVQVLEVRAPGAGDRPSLLCRVAGTGSGRALALYAHLDTVGTAGMTSPFDPVVCDGRLYGRGAYDMKGSLAAIMRVAAGIARRPRAGDLWLLLVADEEHASVGVEAVLRELERRAARPDACIVSEPTDLRLMLGHRGFATGTLVTRGRAAHTARRDEGLDAIAMMARVVVALERLDADMHARDPHALLGHAAVVVSLISGGSELFTYPAECRAAFVRRTLPGETQALATTEIERIFQSLEAADERFDAQLQWDMWREPMMVDAEAPIVRAVAEAARAELTTAPEVCGAPWWTDAALLEAAGIPSVIFGPAGGGIHAADEWVELAALVRYERILLNVTRSFCG